MGAGIKSRFSLQNGKFVLSSGSEKSRDNIWFYCVYDRFRVYCSGFGSNYSSLIQKPVSTLVANKSLILGNIKKNILKYVPDIEISNVDIGYTSSDRKSLKLLIEYSTILENKTKIQDVTFV